MSAFLSGLPPSTAPVCGVARQTPLSPAQQQRVREEEGTFALLRRSYLAATAVADWRRYGQYRRAAACLCGTSHRPGHTTHAAKSAASTSRNARASRIAMTLRRPPIMTSCNSGRTTSGHASAWIS